MVSTATVATDALMWALKIVEVYMLWFTFFLSTNGVVLGWLAGRRTEESAKPLLEPVCWFFIVLDLVTLASTVVVASTVKGDAPASYQSLIVLCGLANSVAAIVAAGVWFVVWRGVRRSRAVGF